MSAGWIDMQEKAFTRWTNDKLKHRGLAIKDFRTDLNDGILLINLLEVISRKSLGGYNRNPRVPMQKLENSTIVLNFLKEEGIKLVNIGPEDIADGRHKLLLGLIWTIILRFQIQGDGSEGSAKNDLLEWVRSKIPEYNINNFTRDWNDGRAICGLVHALDPSLCDGHFQFDPNRALDNATLGVGKARDVLGVPAIIEPSEMINPKLDEHSMMTYISIFRDLENQGAFKKRLDDAAKCRAYGQGLANGIVGQPSEFAVEVPPGCKGKLEVRVEGPKTKVQPIVKRNTDSTYSVTYTPDFPGRWLVHVTLDGVHIPGSVFEVIVLERESLGGEGKIRVFYTTTTCKNEITRPLQELLERKGIHLRADFEPWIPVDIMTKDDRDAVFRVANTRKLPIVYIDDRYIGAYEEMFALEKSGDLDRMLKVNEDHYNDLYAPGKMSKYAGTYQAAAPAPRASSAASKPAPRPAPAAAAPRPAPAAAPVLSQAPAPLVSAASRHTAAVAGNFCPNCGMKVPAGGRFCPGCGNKM